MNLICIQGVTASGKSGLACDLALGLKQKGFTATIFGMDSRQIWQGLDLGTGKIEGKWQNRVSKLEISNVYTEAEYTNFAPLIGSRKRLEIYKTRQYFFRETEHFLIDFIPLKPLRSEGLFTAVDFCLDFYHLVYSLQNKFDYIILVGGTGLYAKSILEQFDYQILSDQFQPLLLSKESKLKDLELTSLQNLYKERLGPINKSGSGQRKIFQSQKELNNSDFCNPYRLQRWLLKNWQLENLTAKPLKFKHFNFEKTYNFWLDIDPKTSAANIEKRLEGRLDLGMMLEIKNLSEAFGSLLLANLGIEYKYGMEYLGGNLKESEFKSKVILATSSYAKRQITWLNKQNIVKISSLGEISACLFEKS